MHNVLGYNKNFSLINISSFTNSLFSVNLLLNIASVTPASSSRPLLTKHTGRNWLDAEIVQSCEGVRCRPARSSADVCQRGAVRQRMGGGNTPGGVSPHPQGEWLALRLECQGDGLHYPVGQPVWRQPSLSAALCGRQRAAQSF